MPPKRKQTIKLVCLCKSRGCGSKTHSALDGTVQPGLEVAKTTFLRHSRAERFPIVPMQLNNQIDKPATSRKHEGAALDPGSTSQETADPVQGSHRHITSLDSRFDDTEPRCTGVANVKSHNCDRFFSPVLLHSHPLLLHVVLTACMLSILEQTSQRTISWLLQSMVSFLLLALDGHLSSSIQLAVSKIPKDIRTATHWLNVNPRIAKMTCCPRCFTLYQIDQTPPTCTQHAGSSHLGKVDARTSNEGSDGEDGSGSENSQDCTNKDGLCGEILLEGGSVSIPIRTYAFQDLEDWIARLLSRPEIEDHMDKTLLQSQKPYDSSLPVTDIQESRIWKELIGPDGRQFTASSGHLTFGMFTNGINPYGNKQSGKHASITFYILVCLTLPWEIRNSPENIFVAGIAPGPSEPKTEQVNSMLRPLVRQLLTLWRDGLYLSRTYRYPQGRLIRAALLTFVADLVALRRTLGFPGATSKIMCSICFLGSKEKSNFNPETWPRRSLEEHRKWSIIARDTTDPILRKRIMKEHGLRYCVLIELPYWNIIEYHVVDSMHNLLLGLLHWHCRHAWAMEDIDDPDDEEEHRAPPKIPRTELEDLQADTTRIWNTPYLPASWNWEDNQERNQNGSEVGFLDLLFGSSSSTDDEDFEPPQKPLDGGWAGQWVPPALDKIILDSAVLNCVNRMLPRIQLPSWIKQGITKLGKVAFGSLKADEWRTLFTIQLVLILIPLWGDGNQVKESLSKNFGHLVSLVNLALKRVMTKDRVENYTSHLQQYLEGVVILFEHVELRPNHHMAFHLAECLERSGPVRAWWSFPFERLMGAILKGCNNNRLGELEVTFLNGFCQGGNLRALLESNEVPQQLKPFLPQLRALYDPPFFVPKDANSSHRLEELNILIHTLLVKTLNHQRWQNVHRIRWVLSLEWATLDTIHRRGSRPVSSQVEVKTSFHKDEIKFSCVAVYPKDVVVTLWVDTPQGRVQRFGEILGIFKHTRRPTDQEVITSEYLHLDLFTEVPIAKGNPFKRLNLPEINGHLCYYRDRTPIIIEPAQLIAHCGYIKYKPGECDPECTVETIGLISLDRK